jgi:hypothetical protein
MNTFKCEGNRAEFFIDAYSSDDGKNSVEGKTGSFRYDSIIGSKVLLEASTDYGDTLELRELKINSTGIALDSTILKKLSGTKTYELCTGFRSALTVPALNTMSILVRLGRPNMGTSPVHGVLELFLFDGPGSGSASTQAEYDAKPSAN